MMSFLSCAVTGQNTLIESPQPNGCPHLFGHWGTPKPLLSPRVTYQNLKEKTIEIHAIEIPTSQECQGSQGSVSKFNGISFWLGVYETTHDWVKMVEAGAGLLWVLPCFTHSANVPEPKHIQHSLKAASNC